METNKRRKLEAKRRVIFRRNLVAPSNGIRNSPALFKLSNNTVLRKLSRKTTREGIRNDPLLQEQTTKENVTNDPLLREQMF